MNSSDLCFLMNGRFGVRMKKVTNHMLDVDCASLQFLEWSTQTDFNSMTCDFIV